MSQHWFTVLTFAVTSCVVGLVFFVADSVLFRYHALVNRRLGELSTKGQPSHSEALFHDQKHLLGTWQRRLEEYLEQAGLSNRIGRLIPIALGAAATLAIGMTLTTGSRWGAVAALPGLLPLPAYIHVKRKLRLRRMFLQVPAALGMISRAVRAGQTVSAAFRLVADELQPPMSDEFRRCYEQQNLGMSNDTSLRMLARRTGIMELRILVVALLVQARTGGNLVGLLDDLTKTVHKRVKFEQRVRALTSEGRMQAGVLMVLPTLAFFGLRVLAPEYSDTLLQHPWLLVATVAAQAVGSLWIRLYLKFDY